MKSNDFAPSLIRGIVPHDTTIFHLDNSICPPHTIRPVRYMENRISTKHIIDDLLHQRISDSIRATRCFIKNQNAATIASITVATPFPHQRDC